MRQSILVLEDDENLQQLIADSLEDVHFDVHVASSAEQAIASAKHHSFQLMLSDVRMAGSLDGVAAIEEVKRLQPQIRSIVMTGFADLEVPVRAAQLQPDSYLLKPVSLSKLLDAVQVALSRDASLPAQNLMERLAQGRDDLVRRLSSWLKSNLFQRLIDVRGKFIQSFYIMMLSKRISADESYSLYAQWVALEADYLKADPTLWPNLLSGFTDLDAQLFQTVAGNRKDKEVYPSLPSWSRFKLLNSNVQQNRASLEQFERSVELLLDDAARSQNLKDYLTYQWLWGEHNSNEQDGLAGLVIGDYRLVSPKDYSCRAAIAYEAKNGQGERHSVFGFPDTAESRELVLDELRNRRIINLGSHRGYLLLLYPTTNLWTAYRPEGLLPENAWDLMRPVFLQVQAHHEQGTCSGEFSFEHIELLPGKEAKIAWFKPDLALKRLKPEGSEQLMKRRVLKIQEIFKIGCAPEILRKTVSHPTPASDQASLAAITIKLIAGDREGLKLWVLLAGGGDQNADNSDFREKLPYLGKLAPVLQRMLKGEPSHRFTSVATAIAELDAALTHEGA